MIALAAVAESACSGATRSSVRGMAKRAPQRHPAQPPAPPRRALATAAIPIIPMAVSFTNAAIGWAWGPRSRTRMRGVLIGTTDGGRTWRRVHAPPMRWAQAGYGSGVSGVALAGRGTGYLFGTKLWRTVDGGRRWRSIRVPGDVLDLVVVRGSTLALVLDCASLDRCDRAHVERVTAAGLRVSGLQASVSVQSSLFGSQRSVYLLASGRTGAGHGAVVLLASHDAGARWQRLATPCQLSDTFSAVAAASSATRLALACGSQPGAGNQAKAFYFSRDGGRHWTLEGTLPFGPGYLSGLAIDGRTWLLAEARLRQFERSTDSGRHWRTVVPAGPGVVEGWGSVAFIGGGRAVAAPWTLNGDVLALSATDGRSWVQKAFG